MTSSQTKSGILTIPLKPGLLVNLVMLVRQPEAYIGAQAATRYFQRFIDIFFMIPVAQTPNASRTSNFLPALNIFRSNLQRLNF